MIYNLQEIYKIIKLFKKLFSQNISINIIVPLPDECDCCFGWNIINHLLILNNTIKSKLHFNYDFDYDHHANYDIHIICIHSIVSKIEIRKNINFVKNNIYIKFFYKNENELNNMLINYNQFIKNI